MSDIPSCPGPDPHPRGPSRFVLPTGAVDTHAHVIGLPPAYPFDPSRSYTPPEATASAYLDMLDAVGMARGVLIQVSVHGTDNRLMVETLQANPSRLRGVAVTDLDLQAAAYTALKDAGVMGLRLNVLFGGGVGLAKLEAYDALCRDMGWHLQLLLDARTLPEHAPRLSRLSVPIVIDHLGHFPVEAGLSEPGFATLLAMVKDGAWVKLSGAFRVSHTGPPYRDTMPFVRALHAAGPNRCVWGSDWPHVATYGPMPRIGQLLDLLADWIPDEAQRDAILVSNPEDLYGF